MREMLIKLLQNFADCTYSSSGTIVDGTLVDDVTDFLIANGVTIQKWIPASDPPKEDGTYLVITTRGTVTTARFYAFKSFPATKYLPATHRSPKWQSNMNVTHWMPLPPKEGKK